MLYKCVLYNKSVYSTLLYNTIEIRNWKCYTNVLHFVTNQYSDPVPNQYSAPITQLKYARVLPLVYRAWNTLKYTQNSITICNYRASYNAHQKSANNNMLEYPIESRWSCGARWICFWIFGPDARDNMSITVINYNL